MHLRLLRTDGGRPRISGLRERDTIRPPTARKACFAISVSWCVTSCTIAGFCRWSSSFSASWRFSRAILRNTAGKTEGHVLTLAAEAVAVKLPLIRQQPGTKQRATPKSLGVTQALAQPADVTRGHVGPAAHAFLLGRAPVIGRLLIVQMADAGDVRKRPETPRPLWSGEPTGSRSLSLC
jgi:hypothetical protein